MNDKLNIAAILKPQGIRGEIKLKVFLDSAECMAELKRVVIDDIDYAVLGLRAQGDTAYITLRGVADRNAAELLRGKEVFAYRDELPPPEEGRYYIADLLGCKAVYSSGETVGVVTEVIPAATDVYVLETTTGEISFAAAKGVIEEVDVVGKKIILNKKRFKEVSV